jgi:rhamnogalacturonan endolyase
MALRSALLTVVTFAVPTLAAFGVTTSSSSYVIDSGNSNGFVVTVSRSDCSITSLKYRGAEYQYGSQTSHIASGLGSVSVSYSIISSKLSCF